MRSGWAAASSKASHLRTQSCCSAPPAHAAAMAAAGGGNTGEREPPERGRKRREVGGERGGAEAELLEPELLEGRPRSAASALFESAQRERLSCAAFGRCVRPRVTQVRVAREVDARERAAVVDHDQLDPLVLQVRAVGKLDGEHAAREAAERHVVEPRAVTSRESTRCESSNGWRAAAGPRRLLRSVRRPIGILELGTDRCAGRWSAREITGDRRRRRAFALWALRNLRRTSTTWRLGSGSECLEAR